MVAGLDGAHRVAHGLNDSGCFVPENTLGYHQPEFRDCGRWGCGFAEAAARSNGRLNYVPDKDLLMPHERMGSVADVTLLNVTHLREHTAQIRVT